MNPDLDAQESLANLVFQRSAVMDLLRNPDYFPNLEQILVVERRVFAFREESAYLGSGEVPRLGSLEDLGFLTYSLVPALASNLPNTHIRPPCQSNKMPATRRSSGNARQTGNKQSTLSFNHRVTKSVPKSAKDPSGSAPSKQSPLAKHVITHHLEQQPDVAAAAANTTTTSDVEIEEDDDDEDKAVAAAPAAAEEEEAKSEAERRAEQVTDAQIAAYWRATERERSARRVHQEGLSLAEKVLRHWDVSSQYGPCVGIGRARRWRRADRLGLRPPPEVLAVLAREERAGNGDAAARAHMDEILGSTAVGAGG
ncbi:DNA polymerase delta, subunit 4-domain-containing protein [Xylariaceae sp. FL0804]|nr:DNA polymerase delta, subunit 4-domain-containing protein [Xylariaceae sp. FL0804]